MRYEIRSLELGGILDQAIALMKNHQALLFGIVLVFMAPLELIGAVAQILDPVHVPVPAMFLGSRALPTTADPLALRLAQFQFFASIFFVYPISNAAVIAAAAYVYLDRPTSARACIRHGFKVFFPVVLTSIIGWTLILLGSCALLVPGIILFLMFWVTTHVVVIEGTWGPAALKRSAALMKGNMSTAFVLGFLIGVAQVALTFAAYRLLNFRVAIGVCAILRILFFLLMASAGVVFYFSNRCKLENFDLILLADSVAEEDEQEPDADAASPPRHSDVRLGSKLMSGADR
jgi:hypothetical protein